MNLHNFIEQLPHLYKDWGQCSMYPKTERFEPLVESPLNSPLLNLFQLLNAAIACLGGSESYCQIGCFMPGSLTAALLDNDVHSSYAVENFSESDPTGEKLDLLLQELDEFGLSEKVVLCDQRIEDFFQELKEIEPEERFGVYLYNAMPDYRSLLMGLFWAKPFLSEEALLIIPNCSAPPLKQAIRDFVRLHPQCQPCLPWELTEHGILGLNNVCLLAWCPNPIDSKQYRLHSNRKLCLHVGSGVRHADTLPEMFRSATWQEIRLDIDPDVAPDILGTITDLGSVPSASVDAVYSSHNLEHIHHHEVPLALAEFKRVLKPDGFALITLPDIQKVAEYVALGRLEDPLYISPAGPIAAVDILYGLGEAIAQGNIYMAHKTAFTAESLRQKMETAGFQNVEVSQDGLNLWAKGYAS